jgi:hypothetical protein
VSAVAEDRALTTVNEVPLALTFVMEPAEAKMQLTKLQEFIRSVMVDGEDYGTIQGTAKPTLYKPGAEKLCEIYGLTPTFEVVEKIEDWQAGFFYYSVRCTLTSRRNGMVYAQGVGSCNSKETKYRYRWVPAEEVPPGVDRAGLVQRRTSKWVFGSEVPEGLDKGRLPKEERTSRKTGKPYTVYDIGQVLYRIENDEGYSVANTVLKMAKKRAHVDATLSATRSSGIFTQDIEDLTDDHPERHSSIDARSEPADAATSPQGASPANGRPKSQTRAQRAPAEPQAAPTSAASAPADPPDVPWSPDYVPPPAPDAPVSADELRAVEDLLLAANRYTDEQMRSALQRVKTHADAQRAIASLCRVVTDEEAKRGILSTLTLPGIAEAVPYQAQAAAS